MKALILGGGGDHFLDAAPEFARAASVAGLVPARRLVSRRVAKARPEAGIAPAPTLATDPAAVSHSVARLKDLAISLTPSTRNAPVYVDVSSARGARD